MAPRVTPNRRQHHGLLAVFSLVLTGLTFGFVPEQSVLDKLSLATAYLCLLLMAAALSIGPLRELRGRPVALNHYLRRDIGIWAAITGLVHLFAGTEVSMSPQYMMAYVNLSNYGISAELRASLFLWGSIVGFVVGIIVLLLLALSNDRIIRWLGAKWWKRLQRSAYLAFVLTVLHGFAFQALESRHFALIGLVLAISFAVVVLQISGARSVRRRIADETNRSG